MMENAMNDPWAALAGPSTRTPRALETREKATPRRAWQEPSLLPDPEPADGWVFKWVRSTTRGEVDKLNVDKRFREGWEPVKAEEHPEILAAWHMDQKSGTIESGGLILCKMPAEMVEQRRQFYQQKTEAGLVSAEEHYMRDSHELVQKIKANKRNVVFGR